MQGDVNQHTGIVKRLLDAMKGESISAEVVVHFMQAFEVLVKTNLSQEVMRSLALFITYAFHSPALSTSRTPKTAVTSRPSTPGLLKRTATEPTRTSTPPTAASYLTKRMLGVKVLGMYSRILCERSNFNHIKKFALTVTNKVSFVFGTGGQQTYQLTHSSGYYILSAKTMWKLYCMATRC